MMKMPDGLYWSLDEHGQPVPAQSRWLCEQLLRDYKRRRVGWDRIVFRGVAVEVSTVFLVLNHNWMSGPPILWESMTFTSDKPGLDGWQRRYQSRHEAETGHAALLSAVWRVLRRHPQSRRRIAVMMRRQSAKEVRG